MLFQKFWTQQDAVSMNNMAGFGNNHASMLNLCDFMVVKASLHSFECTNELLYCTRNLFSQVELLLARELQPFEKSEMTCACREKGSTKSRAMVDARISERDGRKVLCGELPFPGGAEYECGVALSMSKKVLR